MGPLLVPELVNESQIGGVSRLTSRTRRSPLAVQHRGTQHALLHYGEVPPRAVDAAD